MSEAWRALLEEPFMRRALVIGVLVAGTCAYLGTYLVLKRMVFVGAALAEIAAAGLAAGLAIGAALGLGAEEEGTLHALAVSASLIATLGGVVAFWLPWGRRQVSRESLLGYGYAAASAVALLLVALNPGGEMHDLDLVSGHLLFLDAHDVVVVLGVLPAVWLLHALLRRVFVFVSFDPDTARTLGIRAGLHDFLIHASIGVTIAVSMRLVGVLLVFASLVVPPLAGLLLARGLSGAALLSVVLGALAVVAGLLASHAWDLPTGPAIVAAQACLLLPAALVRAVRR